MSKDTIYRQQAIDAVQGIGRLATLPDNDAVVRMSAVEYVLFNLPSAQPEVIRCNDCKYWTQSIGKMKGYGLGKCDFHDVHLVTCNGFCYWAERRDNG